MGVSGLRPRLRLELVADGSVVADERLIALLMGVERLGSILAASRAVGMAYSRAWELIARAEALLGVRLVEARRGGRGGGGARLTDAGRELIARYVEAYRRLVGREFVFPGSSGGGIDCCAVYAGSHDVVLERLLGLVREAGVVFEVHWLGSARGVAAVLLGEADIAGLHIPGETGYNTEYLCRTGAADELLLLEGYRRRIGLVSRSPLGVDEALDGLLDGRLRLVNRPVGAGTRILLDRLLRERAHERGLDPASVRKRVRGYDTTAHTHLEVAARIARGEADVGLAVEWAARLHGLHFTPVAWEDFDFTMLASRADTDAVRVFREILSSTAARRLLSELPGYQAKPGMGMVRRLVCN